MLYIHFVFKYSGVLNLNVYQLRNRRHLLTVVGDIGLSGRHAVGNAAEELNTRKENATIHGKLN